MVASSMHDLSLRGAFESKRTTTMIPNLAVSSRRSLSPPRRGVCCCLASGLPRRGTGSSLPLAPGRVDARRRNIETAALLVASTAQSGMTRAQLLLLLIGCFLLAGLAAISLAWYSSVSQRSAHTQPIVVAARDIDLDASLDASSMQVMPWPAESVQPDAYTDQHSLDHRVTRTQILRGEPILERKLAPPGTKGGLPADVKDGKRTISVKVSEVIGLSGFYLAGSHVDVMVNFRNAKGNLASKMVINGVPVLAVVQMASGDEAKSKAINAVTLEVTQEQAELLEIAGSVGSLTLVVHDGAGKESMRTADNANSKAQTGAESLEARTEQVPPSKAVRGSTQPRADSQSRRRERVEVLRGITKSTTEF